MDNKYESIYELNEKFEAVKNLGYIDGINCKSKGNAGITFEKFIDKANDNFQIPDFNNIEIKVQNQFQNHLIRLFSLVPSNSFGIELKRIRNAYGIYDKEFNDIKILQLCLTTKETFKNNHFFKLEINYEVQKIFLKVYNSKKELVEKHIYWDFDDIISTIERKLKIVAIVNYKKRELDVTQFNYTKIDFFEIKSTIVFFKLIELGIIKINFNLGVYRSGYKIGKEHDNGVSFCINPNNFYKLYSKINI